MNTKQLLIQAAAVWAICFIVNGGTAATVTFEDSADLAENFSVTLNPAQLAWQEGGYLQRGLYDSASIAVYNKTDEKFDNFTVQMDFSQTAIVEKGGWSIGLYAGLNDSLRNGFLGIFRLGSNGADFRLFTGASSTSVGSLYNTITIGGTFSANVFYTCQMTVSDLGANGVSFTAAIYDGSTLIGSNNIIYAGPLDYLLGYTGFRAGSYATEPYVRLDNFTIIIPEPSTWALLGVGSLILVAFRKHTARSA